MSRGNQVSRQWRLIQLLERSRRGRTFEELARELDCTTRTVMRDLDHIQAVGFPVAEDRDGKEKRWKFVQGYRCDLPVPLSLSEPMALYFTRSLLKPLREEIRAEAEALLRRLEVSDALREISGEQLTLPVMGAV